MLGFAPAAEAPDRAVRKRATVVTIFFMECPQLFFMALTSVVSMLQKELHGFLNDLSPSRLDIGVNLPPAVSGIFENFGVTPTPLTIPLASVWCAYLLSDVARAGDAPWPDLYESSTRAPITM